MANERGTWGAEKVGLMVSGVSSSSFGMARRRETSVQRVLADKDLLGCVLSYVGGETGRQSVRALGNMAVVCRTWREAATWDVLWKGIEEKVMVPELLEGQEAGRRAVGREWLIQYGRMLVQERRVWSEVNWAFSLELHVEIFDRMHGIQMLSMTGPLGCKAKEAYNAVVIGWPSWTMSVREPPFSAARINPAGFLSSIWDYVRLSVNLCLRVTVWDLRTGKGGLLWEEGCGTVRVCEDPAPYWEARLPEGSRAVISEARRMVGGAGDGLECYTEFFVCPEPDQAGVGERDRLYRVAMEDDLLDVDEELDDGDEYDYHPFSLKIVGTDIGKVRAAIRAVC
jgi:hypothetical protein